MCPLEIKSWFIVQFNKSFVNLEIVVLSGWSLFLEIFEDFYPYIIVHKIYFKS